MYIHIKSCELSGLLVLQVDKVNTHKVSGYTNRHVLYALDVYINAVSYASCTHRSNCSSAPFLYI